MGFPWYKTFSGRLNGKSIAVINSGRGESSADCVLFLKKKGVKNIIFTGFAGSIRKSFQAGTTCCMKACGGGLSFTDFTAGIKEFPPPAHPLNSKIIKQRVTFMPETLIVVGGNSILTFIINTSKKTNILSVY